MDLTKIPIFRLMNQRMSWLTRRQEVLSHNIANANTPGFVPRELKTQDFRQIMQEKKVPVHLQTTSGNHIAPVRSKSSFGDAMERNTYEAGLDGNAVSLEEQLMKVAENQVNYRMVTNLYRKQIGMIRAVVSRN